MKETTRLSAKTLMLPIVNPTELKEIVASLRERGADNHPVLKEAALYQFWGAATYVMKDKEGPVSLIQMKLGKRKKNAWEPYANWYGAYTLPSHRRQGHATALYKALERCATDVGCRRVKSLAGSSAGLGLHHSLGHQCWGRTPAGEVWVDSPLPGHEIVYTTMGSPPQAPGPLMTAKDIAAQIKEGLRYDK
jgi:GNAT superfamily N-acetyltransferase